MASHRSKSLYAIKECSTCGSLYTKDCCSIGSLNDKILVSESDSSPCCAKCGTPVDGPYCRGCAFLRKKFEEDLLTYCVENGFFKDFQDTSKSSDDNTNVVNAPREPFVVNQDPGVKSSQDPPQIDHNLTVRHLNDDMDTILAQKNWRRCCPGPKMSIGSSLEIKLMDIAYNVGKNIEALFDTVDERKDTFSFNISICVLEVYNEQIKSGICLLPHEQQRRLLIEKIRKCMGDPEADVDNEVLKYEQDSQTVYAIDLETNECIERNGGCWIDSKSQRHDRLQGVAPPMDQREEVYDPLATPDVDNIFAGEDTIPISMSLWAWLQLSVWKALYVDELENLLDDFKLSHNTEIDDGSIEEENWESKHPQLLYDAKLYNYLQGLTGVAAIHWSGNDIDDNVLVLDLLGPCLKELFIDCGYTREQSGQAVMTREEDDRLSVSIGFPKFDWFRWTLAWFFVFSTKLEVVFLGGNMLAEVILVKGHELPTIVKVLPISFHLSPTSVNT
ncbi:hypothetical protein Tco_0513778 [Tanacetum coccineum]